MFWKDIYNEKVCLLGTLNIYCQFLIVFFPIVFFFLHVNIYFQFILNRILSKTHKKCKHITHFKKGILGIY